MLMLILMSTSNVHAEEWETFVKVQTEELVTERFNADYGAADFWEELVDANGPFRFWTVEQKNWYSSITINSNFAFMFDTSFAIYIVTNIPYGSRFSQTRNVTFKR